MFAYSLGYVNFEGDNSLVLLHEKHYTENEWIDLVLKYTVDAARDYIEKAKAKYEFEGREKYLKSAQMCRESGDKANEAYFMWHAEPENQQIDVDFETLYKQVADILVDKEGFTLLEIHQSICLFGWDCLCATKGTEASRDDARLRKIVEAVNEIHTNKPYPDTFYEESEGEGQTTFVFG